MHLRLVLLDKKRCLQIIKMLIDYIIRGELFKDLQKIHKQLSLLIIIAITMIMLLHFIDITIFAHKYTYSFNYGNSLKGLCSNEYFEYETGRFQVANNADDIKIDTESQKKYNMIIFIVCIIVSFWVSILFSIFVYNIGNITIKYINSYTLNKDYFLNGLYFLLIVFVLSVAFWIIIYLSLIFTIGNNQSPFSKNPYQSYIMYIIIITFVLQLLYLLFGLLDENEFRSKGWSGAATFVVFVAFYLCTFYILGSVKSIVFDKKSITSQEISKSENISSIFFGNVLGFTNLQKFADEESKFIYIDRLSGVFATSFIIFVVMFIVYLLLKKYSGDEKDQKLILYGILIPSFILSVVLFVASNVNEFNIAVNKYIVDDPVHYYKEYVYDLNNIFNNKVLSIDYDKIIDTKQVYVCKNYGNGILTVFFAKLFDGMSILGIDLTPEFNYEDTCNDVFPYEFYKDNEYQMSYYLNSKQLKKSMFYKYDKCDDVNIDIVKQLFQNIIKITLSGLTDNDKNLLKDIYDDVNKNNNQNKSIVNVLKDNYSNKIHKIDIDKILQALKNIKEEKNYLGNPIKELNDKSLKIARLEAHNNNNKLDYAGIGRYNTDIEIEKYRSLIEQKLLDQYENMSYELLYVFAEGYKLKTNIDEIDEIFKNKNFITKVTNIIKKYFDIIVKNLSTPTEIKTSSITKYIISNYNSIVDADKKYRDRVFKIENRKLDSPENDDRNKKLNFCSNINDIKYKIFPILQLNTSNYVLNNDIDNKITYLRNYDDVTCNLVNELLTDRNKYNFIENQATTSFEIYNISQKKDLSINKSDPNAIVNAYNIAYNILKSCKLLNNEISNKIGIEKSVDQTNLLSVKTNIEDYRKKINNNLNALHSDCKRYINEQDIKNVQDTLSKSKKTALAIIENAKQANEIIYLIIFTYIVILICAILFVYIR